MPIEIERKFLVRGQSWRSAAIRAERFCQGYLNGIGKGSVRVRRSGAMSFITIKGPRDGISRSEFEYPIPLDDAEQMLSDLCVPPLLEKIRHSVEHGGQLWEVDVFTGAASGLVIAELELGSADQHLAVPQWAVVDVSEDDRFRSSAIARHPDQALKAWDEMMTQSEARPVELADAL